MTRLLAVLAAAVLALTACSSSGGTPSPKSSQLVGADQSSTFAGSPLTPPQPRPSIELTDTSGKPFSFSTVTSKHPTLLYFGYTNCPDVCPTTMFDVQKALKAMPAAVAKTAYVVFVSTDVKRDTGAVIKEWLSNFSAGTTATWVGLRGTQAQIDAAQAAAHVTLAEDGGQTHSSEMLLYGPDNYAHVDYIQSNTLSAQIAHDVPLVAAGKS